MASLHALSSLRGRQVGKVPKVVSLAFFFVLLSAGWLITSYIKIALSGSPPATGPSIATPVSADAPAPRSGDLVYQSAADHAYYHSLAHLPAAGHTTALSEESAIRLGLRPCPVCFHHTQ